MNGAVYIGGGMAALAVAILVATYVFTTTVPEEVVLAVPEEVVSDNIPLTPADATEFEDLTLVEIFENTEASVVRIIVDRNSTDMLDPNRDSLGSGIVFDRMGNIVTNAHVVEDSLKTEVTFLDGRTYEAEIVGVDVHTDLAVVNVDVDPELLQPIMVGDSSMLKVGQSVAAIGNPFGLSGSMTSGIVSQIDRLLATEST